MAGEAVTASMLAASVASMRFDTGITAFQFQPSLGIVAKNVETWLDDIKDLHVPLERGIKKVMVPSIRKNFTSGGRPDWEELSYDTVRKRKGSTSPILVRTSRLKKGVTNVRIWSIGKTSATIRDLPAPIWYGKVHQAGSEGNDLGGGNWFGKYERAAKKMLGDDAKQSEITATAFEIFDGRMKKHGPAPAATATIPARPFAVFQDEDIEEMAEIMADYLIERLKKVGKWGG
jgi:phage gpG-like protein